MINIVLFQPEIPSNCGNIVRTCSAINAHLHLIHPLGFSLKDKDFLRAGMDYIQSCKISEYNSIEDFYKLHPNQKIYYITRYATKVYSDEDYSSIVDDYYFMFGKESTGIDQTILQNNISTCLRIPMKPNARSLNLSNCVALVSYEVCRQQDFFSLATEEVQKKRDFLVKD